METSSDKGTPARAMSFGRAARDYDRFRPGPPSEALDWLVPPGCASVLDLGAGTGLLTRRLVERAGDVTAVEPDGRMREVLADNCPRATVLEGTAESIPLPGSRVEAVMVSAAWHWMDPERALPEIARVLTPGGRFGVLYTRRDRAADWLAGLDASVRELTAAGDGVARRITRMSTEAWLSGDAPFSGLEAYVLSWEAPMSIEAVVGMYTTYSSFITLPDPAKQRVVEEIGALVRERAPRAEDGTVPMPMTCHCWRMHRA